MAQCGATDCASEVELPEGAMSTPFVNPMFVASGSCNFQL